MLANKNLILIITFILFSCKSICQDTKNKNDLFSVNIGNYKDSILSINQITSTPHLNICYNSDNKIEYQVIRFNLTIIDIQTKKETRFNNTFGNKLTDKQINVIEKLSSGSKLIFNDVKFICNECATLSIKFKVIIK